MVSAVCVSGLQWLQGTIGALIGFRLKGIIRAPLRVAIRV